MLTPVDADGFPQRLSDMMPGPSRAGPEQTKLHGADTELILSTEVSFSLHMSPQVS